MNTIGKQDRKDYKIRRNIYNIKEESKRPNGQGIRTV